MKNEELTVVLAELAQAGIYNPVIAKGGRHLQIRWETAHGNRCYVVSATGSDWRGPHNARATVRRMLRADGLLTERSETSAPPSKPRDWRVEVDQLKQRVARLEAALAAAPRPQLKEEGL